MCSQNAGNAISETQILKISWGGHAPRFNPLANSCLRYSAHTFGDRILCWGRARKMGPLAVLPHHWRILKKCTDLCIICGCQTSDNDFFNRCKLHNTFCLLEHHVNLLLQSFRSHIISTDEDPGLRVQSFAVINLRGVSTNKKYYILETKDHRSDVQILLIFFR
jgi:hypothetical protein